MKIQIIFIQLLIRQIYCYDYIMKNNYILLGNWKLRNTNDKRLNNKYSLIYLNINFDDTFKLKCIDNNGIVATKTCNYGKFYDYNKIYHFFNKNEYHLYTEFNIINKFSYSFFGIKFPEIQIIKSNKKIIKNIIVKKINNVLFISCNKKYYIFDLYNNNNKLPYIEMSINTLFISQIIGFFIYYIL